nr:hypothetical protein [Frigoribacterium sp. CFBP 13605]
MGQQTDLRLDVAAAGRLVEGLHQRARRRVGGPVERGVVVGHAADRGTDQQHARHALGCGHGQVEGERTTHRVADDERPPDAQPVEQLHEVGQVRGAAVGRGGRALAEPPAVVGHQVEPVGREFVGDARPAPAVGDAGVQQHHGRAVAPPPGGRQGGTVRQGHVHAFAAHVGHGSAPPCPCPDPRAAARTT